MSKLALWIQVSLKVMTDNVNIIEECYRKNELDLMVQQARTFRKYIDSFISMVEARRDTQ